MLSQCNGGGRLDDEELGDVVSQLRSKWEKNPDRSSKNKWTDFVALMKVDKVAQTQIASFSSNTDSRFHTKTGTLKPAAEDIVLQYTYPRLDANVSKHRNHLLKAPFCIHPGTGRICVPVDPAKVSEFDPMTVPTIGQLLEELGSAQDVSAGEHQSGEHSVGLGILD